MTGVFDIEIHDSEEPVEVSSEDDTIEIENVSLCNSIFYQYIIHTLFEISMWHTI